MKYINIATNDSDIMVILRSVFLVEELKKLRFSVYNIVSNTNYLVILDKSIFYKRGQVTVGDPLSNNLYFIYYESELSKELIKTCITGDKSDFFRAIIRYTSDEFKRMIYWLLSNSVRKWLMGDNLHIYIHCDNYEFSDGNTTFKVFMTRSDFHGEIHTTLRPDVKFDIRKESAENIAKKINEIFKIIEFEKRK